MKYSLLFLLIADILSARTKYDKHSLFLSLSLSVHLCTYSYTCAHTRVYIYKLNVCYSYILNVSKAFWFYFHCVQRRTIARYLYGNFVRQKRCKEDAVVKLSQVLEGKTKKGSARLFYEVLVIAFWSICAITAYLFDWIIWIHAAINASKVDKFECVKCRSMEIHWQVTDLSCRLWKPGNA